MITSNVIQRVFRISYRGSVGTCFTIDVDDQQYFVTAKHVVQVENETEKTVLGKSQNVEIFHKGKWNSAPVMEVYHSKDADVSVFTIKPKIPAPPLPASTEGIIYGQDLYFLGFPYNLKSEVGEINRDFPLPLVKKGILSAMFFSTSEKAFLIDGHNNAGFSGGPVVYQRPGERSFRLAGVVSGYVKEQKPEGGKLVPIEDTNSGIMIAYSIAKAIELLR